MLSLGRSARPSIVPIAGPLLPHRKWGGDNSDAIYSFAPLDPRRSYRLRGQRGDSVYLSITVYAGPADERWSSRIVRTLNDQELAVSEDGSFEVNLGPGEAPRGAPSWVQLEPDSVALITCDYLEHPASDRPASWQIEALDAAPPPRLDDAELARRFRATANFLRDLLNINPLPESLAPVNEIEEPHPVPAQTYGWAAGDACYAMGRFALAEDQALVIEGCSLECAFWNLCLWNPYMQTYDYRYERVTLNGGQVSTEKDGSWRIVIAARDPRVPNWVSTADHPSGWIWFRWFLAKELQPQPRTRLAPLAELAGSHP